MDKTFKTYVDNEVARFSRGDMQREEQLLFMISKQPRLETALMLQALCLSLDDGENLVDALENTICISEEQERYRNQTLNNWKQLIDKLSFYSASTLKEILQAPTGEAMEKIGFSAAYVKYADLWNVWKERDESTLNYKNAPEFFVKEIQNLLKSFAEDINESVVQGLNPAGKYYVTIIGSAVFMWEGYSTIDTTEDIDIYSYNLPQNMSHPLVDYQMNTRSMAYPYTLPYNYENRLVKIIDKEYCCIYRVSWEDILFAKLQRADNRDHNDADVLARQGEINWNLLRFIITDAEEACGSGMTRSSYQELLLAYNAFAKRWEERMFSNDEIFTLMNNAL